MQVITSILYDYTFRWEKKAYKGGSVTSSGMRKTAHAICYLRPGTGQVTVNNQKYIDYFP